MENIYIYNTLSRKKEQIMTLRPGALDVYCCGPTVYNYAHIGNLRTYIFEDILRRVAEMSGYTVKHVMNITDIGHLTGIDEGDDKMVTSAKRAQKSVTEIAEYYTEAFFKDCARLRILSPHVVCKATEHIADMIALIRRIEDAGYTYQSGGNVYFDTERYADYGRLARLRLEQQEEGARVAVDSKKRHPHDFVLWFTESKYKDHLLLWPSPWGDGYPGWHIECSAMSMKYLGEQFDMHCGGADHIPLHHTNEIAQVESVTNTQWVQYWVHGEFLLLDKDKMSKSGNRFLTLDTLTAEGFDALDYRYFCLGGHYQSQLNFSLDSLKGARTARRRLIQHIRELRDDASVRGAPTPDAPIKGAPTPDAPIKGAPTPDAPIKGAPTPHLPATLTKAAQRIALQGQQVARDNLNTPRLLALTWDAIRSEDLCPADKVALFDYFDTILAITDDGKHDAGDQVSDDMRARIEQALNEREQARAHKDWAEADRIRDSLAADNIEIKDTAQGTVWHVKKNE